MFAEINIPPTLVVGPGSTAAIGDIAARHGIRRPLVVTDRFLAGTGLADRVAGLLAAGGAEPAVFSETVPDPTTDSLDTALAALRALEADGVVALGGGSPIDTGKALAVLARRGGSIRELKAPAVYDGPALPIIAIPTTAGTGSEGTRFTVITDTADEEKMLCIGTSYLPAAAIVDVELTMSMPPRLTADTGLDALTHAIEAHVSSSANTFSDLMAMQAITLIGTGLRAAYADGDDAVARERMILASTLAGIAFSNSSVALVHGMSRPIGAHFGIAHGMANAMLLAEVTAFGLRAAQSRYADCARALGVALASDDDAAAGAALLAELRSLATDLAVPTPRSLGISHGDWHDRIPLMARQAVASGSPAKNPRVPELAEIEDLYRAIYG